MKTPTPSRKSRLQAAAKALGLSPSGNAAAIQGRIDTAFGYNAVEDKGRRQATQKRTMHESKVLTVSKRAKLLATAQDQARNHSLVAWMIRKHLDYVSRFHFSFRTDRDPIDKLVNRIFEWHGRPRNFDISARLGRNEMFRMFECEKVLSGDAGMIKITDGLKLQAIESDMIAKPKTIAPESIKEHKAEFERLGDSGLILGPQLQRELFCICNRGGSGRDVTFDHFEDDRNMIFDAYWGRFASQDRGISPLSTAINTVQDLSEAFEHNIVKAKLHALFGIAITRDAMGEGDMGPAGVPGEGTDQTADDLDTHLDLNPTSINILDMNPGESVQTIESGTPSVEFVNASYLYIQLAMLALDIPVTCFDSRRSSFSGRIADLNEYEVSVRWKQEKNLYCRKDYSDWLLYTIWNDPESQWRLKDVASSVGMSLIDVQSESNWIPSGSPWLDKYKQVLGDELSIAIGLDNRESAARRRGQDVYANIDAEARVQAYAKSRGVELKSGAGSDRTIGDTTSETDTNQNQDQGQ